MRLQANCIWCKYLLMRMEMIFIWWLMIIFFFCFLVHRWIFYQIICLFWTAPYSCQNLASIICSDLMSSFITIFLSILLFLKRLTLTVRLFKICLVPFESTIEIQITLLFVNPEIICIFIYNTLSHHQIMIRLDISCLKIVSRL